MYTLQNTTENMTKIRGLFSAPYGVSDNCYNRGLWL